MGDFDLFNAPVAQAPPSAPAGAAAASAAPADDFSAFDQPAAPARSFWQRAYDSVAGGVKAVGHVAGEQAGLAARLYTDPVGTLGTSEGREQAAKDFVLTNPSKRRELERGIGDVTTLGYGNKLAEKADEFANKKFGLERQMTPEKEAEDAENAPEYRTAGQVAGSALPNPLGEVAGVIGKAGGAAAERLAPAAVDAVKSAASRVPAVIAGPAKAIAGYEAQAPAAAALSADSAGHRIEAAKEAATDPGGLVLSGALGVAPAVAKTLQDKLAVAGAKAPAVQEAGKRRAVKDLGKDITSAEGVSARATDKKRIAEVNDRLYDLADKNPELRQAFGEPAEKALPKIQAFKDRLAEPLDRLYDAIDTHTGGGLDPRQVVQDFRDQAKAAGKSVAGHDDAIRLNTLADRFEKVYVTGAEPAAPTQPHGVGEPPLHNEEWWKEAEREWTPGKKGHTTVGDVTNPGAKGAPKGEDLGGAIEQLRKLRENAKGVAAEGIDAQIAKLEGEQKAAAPAARAQSPAAGTLPKIPTRVFRQEVTDLLKRSDSIMGAIEGTPRHEALQRLYEAGKSIIDKHIDGSGLPAPQIAQIRDINNGYFLLSRAEQAIESRGWKEANKPGFKFPTTVRQAVHGGGIAGLATAAAIGGPHALAHAVPVIAGTAIGTHALPAAAKRLNWSLAHGSYGRAVERLTAAARRIPSATDFIAAATRAGMGPAVARRIYLAAHPEQQGAPP